MNVPTHRPLRTWRVARWSAAALLLLLPWVVMQITGDFGWDLADFVVFGAMLVMACGAYELIAHLTSHCRNRWLAGAAIVAVFLLVWVELAVGIFH
jgi:membrane protein YdbS with pleckstrin-like domain